MIVGYSIVAMVYSCNNHLGMRSISKVKKAYQNVIQGHSRGKWQINRKNHAPKKKF
jgi:hypothetical protein